MITSGGPRRRRRYYDATEDGGVLPLLLRDDWRRYHFHLRALPLIAVYANIIIIIDDGLLRDTVPGGWSGFIYIYSRILRHMSY